MILLSGTHASVAPLTQRPHQLHHARVDPTNSIVPQCHSPLPHVFDRSTSPSLLAACTTASLLIFLNNKLLPALVISSLPPAVPATEGFLFLYYSDVVLDKMQPPFASCMIFAAIFRCNAPLAVPPAFCTTLLSVLATLIASQMPQSISSSSKSSPLLLFIAISQSFIPMNYNPICIPKPPSVGPLCRLSLSRSRVCFLLSR